MVAMQSPSGAGMRCQPRQQAQPMSHCHGARGSRVRPQLPAPPAGNFEAEAT